MGVLSGIVDAFDPSGKSVWGAAKNLLVDNPQELGHGLATLGKMGVRDLGTLLTEGHDGDYVTDDIAKMLPSAIKQDYADRYWNDVGDNLYERPLDYLLDAAGVYGAAKGAGLAGKAVTKAEIAAAQRFPGAAEKVSRYMTPAAQQATMAAPAGMGGVEALAGITLPGLGRKGRPETVAGLRDYIDRFFSKGKPGYHWGQSDPPRGVYQKYDIDNINDEPSTSDFLFAEQPMRANHYREKGLSPLPENWREIMDRYARDARQFMPYQVQMAMDSHQGHALSPKSAQYKTMYDWLLSEEPEAITHQKHLRKMWEEMGVDPDGLVRAYFGGNVNQPGKDYQAVEAAGFHYSLDPKVSAGFAAPHGAAPVLNTYDMPAAHVLAVQPQHVYGESEIHGLSPANLFTPEGNPNVKGLLDARRDPGQNALLKKVVMAFGGGDARALAKMNQGEVPDLSGAGAGGGWNPLIDGDGPIANIDDQSLANTYQPIMDDAPDPGNYGPGVDDVSGLNSIKYNPDTQQWEEVVPSNLTPEDEAFVASQGGAPTPVDEPVDDAFALGLINEGTADIGGEGHKVFYRDHNTGERYLFKVARTKYDQSPFPAKAHAEELGSKLQSIIHGPDGALPISVANMDGEFGALLPFVEGAQDLTAMTGATDLTPLIPQLAQQLPDFIPHMQREHVLDWLISQHDTQPAQVIVSPDGKIHAIDKEQAFRYFETPTVERATTNDDALDWDFHPNHMYGEKEPVYNSMVKSYIDGNVSLTSSPYFEAIERIEAMDDGEYLQMLQPYADSLFTSVEDANAFFNKALMRKRNLREDFEGFIERIKMAKAEKTGIYPDQGVVEDIVDPATGVTIRTENASPYAQLDPDNVGPKDLSQVDPGQRWSDEQFDPHLQQLPEQHLPAMKQLNAQGIPKKHAMLLLRKKFPTMSPATLEFFYDQVRKGAM